MTKVIYTVYLLSKKMIFLSIGECMELRHLQPFFIPNDLPLDYYFFSFKISTSSFNDTFLLCQEQFML